RARSYKRRTPLVEGFCRAICSPPLVVKRGSYRVSPGAQTRSGPTWLAALDELELEAGGWTAECPILGCGGRLAIGADHDEWVVVCTGGELGAHDGAPLAAWLGLELETFSYRGTEWSMRAWLAVVLARTPDTARALLEGRDVPESALDASWLRRLRRTGLWV